MGKVLKWGAAAKNSRSTIFSPSPCLAYRKKSRYVYIYVKLFS